MIPAEKIVGRWRTVPGSRRRTKHSFLLVESVRRTSTRTGRDLEFEYLRLPNWVNIIAVTPRRSIIFVRQYRHGVDDVVIELPAGSVGRGENERDAAVRELLEETGYRGTNARRLGNLLPNTAIQTNSLSTWLILNAEPVLEPRPDSGEHIEVVELPFSTTERYIRAGRIRSALSLAALYLYRMDQRSARSSKLIQER